MGAKARNVNLFRKNERSFRLRDRQFRKRRPRLAEPWGYKMRNAILRRLAGPGLIFTGSAIGTSHLVQSTRAGAMFGVALLGVIVLSTLLKYPTCACGDVFRAGAR